MGWACPRRSGLWQDTAGGITAFVAVIFIIMFVGVGLGIDFMRHETERAELQSALDRGVLAAASMRNTMEPEQTVRDYIRSANAIGAYSVVVEEDRKLASRRITARATSEIPTYFLKVVGIDRLSVSVESVAFEGVSNVEVSLVLDISGSMASERTGLTDAGLQLVRDYPRQDVLDWDGQPANVTRLDMLRVAASRFVEQLLADTNVTDTSINLIPFAGQVNIGKTAFDYFAKKEEQPNSHCIELIDKDFVVSDLPARNSRKQVDHYQWFYFEADRGKQAEWGWCPSDKQAVAYLSNNEQALKNEIAEFVAHDGTGTQIGMKWGLSLLSPDAKRLFEELRKTNELSGFEARPYPFRGEDVMKVIILMTDGITQYQVDPNPNRIKKDWGAESLGEADGWVLGKFWSREMIPRDEARAQLVGLCQLAMDLDVVVFTIGFDIADGSVAEQDLRDCASDPAFFYDVDGAGLVDAFDAIAATISKLRLVQ